MDIAVTQCERVMYQIAKVSNDAGLIEYFVYNNGEKGTGYFGKFVLVMADGFYVQNDDCVLELSCIESAAAQLGRDAAEIKAILSELLKQAREG